MVAERLTFKLAAACLGFVLLISAGVSATWATPQVGERKDLEINVRLATGAQAPVRVEVVARSVSLSVQFRAFTDSSGQVLFSQVLPGYYLIEIDAEGYERVSEEISVDESNPVTKVYINLRPLGMKTTTAPAAAVPVLPSKARKEVEKAQLALRSKNYPDAERYITRALKIAPAHPFVNYLAGLLYYRQDKLDLAQAHLEKATLLNSTHAPSFGLLGTVLYRKGKYAGAIAALERALVLDPNPWESHWAIANAYFQEKRFEKARAHAERARQFSQGKAPDISLVLGISLAYLGEKEQAITELENYLATAGDRPGAEQARQMLTRLRTPDSGHTASPAEGTPTTPVAASVDAPALAGIAEDWAPPDVDASKPSVDPSIACSLPNVLKPTAANTAALLKNLEKIGAKETIELSELDALGNTKYQRRDHFDYVVGIREAPQHRVLFVEESRRALSVAETSLSRTYTASIPALALVFHPYYVNDFQLTCEGLGQWHGEPTWLVHFRQRDDKPSRLFAYEIRGSQYQVPLKGRAWIGANSYQVMRIETNLIKPVEEIALQQEHLNIEYKPVYFQRQKLELWLPEAADVYTMRNKRRMHLRHTFTDFMLFLVDMKQEIKAPKQPKAPEEQPPS